MKKIVLISLAIFAAITSQAQVIISQYYEGSSNNKWIEITNVGNTTASLDGLFLCLFSNARADNPDGESPNNNTALSGTLAAGASILFRNSSAVLPSYATGTSSTVCSFNGDDLVIISSTNNTTAWANRSDVVGNGTSWGGNTSFYRNSSVLSGNTTFTLSEWTEVTNTTVDNATAGTSERLGEHEFDAPLPIALSFFSAEPMDSKSVDLSWSTRSEENNEYFSIEHSINGREFVEIDQIEGAINSSVERFYTYIHKDAAEGTNYYRLKQVNIDGTFSYSPIEAVRLAIKMDVDIFPTLAENQVTLAVSVELDSDVQIEVYNILGRLVSTDILERGATQTILNVANLQKGQYLVRISNGADVHTSRFIKK